MEASKCWTYTKFDNKVLFSDDECKYRIEGREICPDTGKEHWQCYVWLKERIRFSGLKKRCGETHFDKARGTPYQNFLYCSKDGDFVEVGIRPTPPKKVKVDAQECFSKAYKASTVEEGISIIREKRPRDLAIHGETIERNLKKAKVIPVVSKYFNFNVPFRPLNKATLVYGDTGYGKTAYAMGHFQRPLMISHMDELRNLSPDHDGIVFDDLSFKHCPPEAVIHMLDMEYDRAIHMRYTTATLFAGLKRIFTHNTENPFYNNNIDESQKEAIERRLDRVHVLNKLF